MLRASQEHFRKWNNSLRVVTKKMTSYIGHPSWRILGKVGLDNGCDVPWFMGALGRVP